MRKLIFLFLSIPVFIASSCDKETPELESVGDIEIIFKANYDGETFFTQKEYDYDGDMSMKLTMFNFFISNLALLEEQTSTEETELLEIDFVDLSFNETQMAEAEAGIKITARNIPIGSYNGFKIGFGVPADLNRTNPNDYGSGDVLANAGHFWAPWESYIFSKIEGFADKDGNGVFESTNDEGLTYHMGTDELYPDERVLFPSNPLIVEDGGTIQVVLNIDVKKMFNMPLVNYDENEDGLLDIEMFDGTHGSTEEELEVAQQLMKNFSDAISLNN